MIRAKKRHLLSRYPHEGGFLYGLGNTESFGAIDPEGRPLFLSADRPRLFSRAYNQAGKAGRNHQTADPLRGRAFRHPRGAPRGSRPQKLPADHLAGFRGSSIIGKDLAHESITTSVEEALRLNVAAVGMSVFVGSEYEFESLTNLGKLVDECQKFGVPVMAVTAVGKELEKRDARYLALCCRIAAELGATIVKTYWCENFEKVVNGCPVPVVMAGGPRCETEREVFDFVSDGMRKGAIGLNLGRNVWQHAYPVAMMKALRAIIHEKATAQDAETIFQEEKRKAQGA